MPFIYNDSQIILSQRSKLNQLGAPIFLILMSIIIIFMFMSDKSTANVTYQVRSWIALLGSPILIIVGLYLINGIITGDIEEIILNSQGIIIGGKKAGQKQVILKHQIQEILISTRRKKYSKKNISWYIIEVRYNNGSLVRSLNIFNTNVKAQLAFINKMTDYLSTYYGK